MSIAINSFLVVLGYEFLLILILSNLSRLGGGGKSLLDYCTKAPGLDGVLALLIWLPWIVSAATLGWLGLAGVLLAQITAMQIWVVAHESMHRAAVNGPRIVGFINQHYGWWRNNLALWVTSVVLPVFFLIRLAQVFVYPGLEKLLGFRTYDHSEWISVSRQKFSGLVGHDLIWCLYCDWMTGVYSLGAEMLRNVESFWCPIRFYDGKKCENCQIDFPDIAKGWVATDGTMADVVKVLEENTDSKRSWTWFNHRDRLDNSDNL